MKYKGSCGCTMTPEGGAGFLLRLSIGLLFFTAGLGKFMGEGGPTGVSHAIMGQFSDTYLPALLVAPYAYALPYLELIIGILLIVGLFARATLAASGLLLVSLAFGMMVKQNGAVVAQNLNYVVMNALALWFVGKDNRFGVDYYIARFWCAKTPDTGA